MTLTAKRPMPANHRVAAAADRRSFAWGPRSRAFDLHQRHSRASNRSRSRKDRTPLRYRIDLACLHRVRFRRRVTKPDRHQPFPRDLEIENIEPVVIADNVVELLRLDTLRDIDVLVQKALGLAQDVADHFA
jgi:hypothetical protein